MSADLDREQLKQREMLFGKFSEGFRPLRPHRLRGKHSQIVEIPVTTMPLLKIPIHLSYVMYLGQISPWLAKSYFRFAMMMCQLAHVQPSLLLHPLDFLGADDDSDLAFFPAMGMEISKKLDLAGQILDIYQSHYNVVPMLEHAKYADAMLPNAKLAASIAGESTSQVETPPRLTSDLASDLANSK